MHSATPALPRRRLRRIFASTAGALFVAAGLFGTSAFAATPAAESVCQVSMGNARFVQVDNSHVQVKFFNVDFFDSVAGDAYKVSAQNWVHTGTVAQYNIISFDTAANEKAVLEYHNQETFKIVISKGAATVCSTTVTMVPPSLVTTTTAKPVPTTVKPVTTTVKPVTTTVKPVPTTVKPVPTTVKPVTTTVKPIPTTVKPVPTTVKPVTTTVKPVVTTSTTAPATTTTVPATTSTTAPAAAVTTTTAPAQVLGETIDGNDGTGAVVEATALSSNTNGDSANSLAFTGSNVGPEVGLGLGLVGIGVAMVWVAMYRRDRQSL